MYQGPDAERQSLTGNDQPKTYIRHNSQRRSIADFEQKTLKKKICYVITSLLLLVLMLGSTALILHSTGSDQENPESLESENVRSETTILVEIDSFEGRNTFSENENSESIQSDVVLVTNSPEVESDEGSGDIKESDDEDIFEDLFATKNYEISTTQKSQTTKMEPEKPVEPVSTGLTILDDIRGKWQQIRSINLKPYLAKEGGNFLYRAFAASVEPELEMKEISKNKWQQIYVVPLTKKVYPMEFGGPYEHKDGLGDPVTSTAQVQSDNTILITARGSRSGVVTTVIQIKDGELWLTQTMPEKGGIQNSRIFKKVT